MAWSMSVDTVLANKGKNYTKKYIFKEHMLTQFTNTAVRCSHRFAIQLTHALNQSSAAAKGMGAAVLESRGVTVLLAANTIELLANASGTFKKAEVL